MFMFIYFYVSLFLHDEVLVYTNLCKFVNEASISRRSRSNKFRETTTTKVLSNEDNVSWSRTQREPLIGLELTNDRLRVYPRDNCSCFPDTMSTVKTMQVSFYSSLNVTQVKLYFKIYFRQTFPYMVIVDRKRR